MTSRDAETPRPGEAPPSGGDGDSDGGGGGKPGDGYRIEISSVRKVMEPLEESVVAARKIKNDWEPMAAHINNSATIDIVTPAKDVLSSWGYGMGRVAGYADTIVTTLQQVIAAYVLADLLRIKDFAPTEDNMAKLPFGEHGMRAWESGSRPDFDPAPRSLQEAWPDDGASGDSGGAGKPKELTTDPRRIYDGGKLYDGIGKAPAT